MVWLRDGCVFGLAGIAAMILCAAGCGGGVRPYQASIQSEDPHERILAIRSAVDTNDQSAIPLIVDRLEDEDEAVQIFAFIALHKITGQRMGYELGQNDLAREQAVERWRDFVRRGDYKVTLEKKSKSADDSRKALTPQAAASGT
jgi:hypothetical protein